MDNLQYRSSRLISLDVFRGLTIVLMIIVNSPGNQMPYTWLAHSVWNGCTFADLVFPFFIVIVGISSALVLSKLKAKGAPFSQLFVKVLWRSVYIFLMGLLLNAFPNHFDPSTIRILGVLQRIALCYFFSALLFLTTRIRTQAILMFVLLLGYNWIMTHFAPLEQGVNLVGYLDGLVLSPAHLYTPTFDPEGLLSTLPAIASALLGNLMGCLLLSSKSKKQQLAWLLIAGLILLSLGWLWSFTFPLNKALWSSSYVLWTGGLALLVYAALFALIEMRAWTRWSTPFSLFGRHAMLVYMLHVLFLKIQALFHLPDAAGKVVGFRIYITELLFGYFSPANAALLYAISYTLLWFFVLKCVELNLARKPNCDR